MKNLSFNILPMNNIINLSDKYLLTNKNAKNEEEYRSLSQKIFDTIENVKMHKEAKKIAEKMDHIAELKFIYDKYQKEFADMIARYAIKKEIDHKIEYGHYEWLHNLSSNEYLNEQERKRIEKKLDTCALNYIKRHTPSVFKGKVENESLYEFENLVKIIYTDYISEPVRKKAEKLVLKRVKNKEEFSKNLLLVREDVNLSQEMRDIAGNTLEEREKK
jgi:hypothetical protein